MGSCVLERPPGISAGRWPAGSSQTVRVMGCRDRAEGVLFVPLPPGAIVLMAGSLGQHATGPK